MSTHMPFNVPTTGLIGATCLHLQRTENYLIQRWNKNEYIPLATEFWGAKEIATGIFGTGLGCFLSCKDMVFGRTVSNWSDVYCPPEALKITGLALISDGVFNVMRLPTTVMTQACQLFLEEYPSF